ncbi:MAG: tannase/feruloyl esterase family alpha/beta hydrolase [Rhodoferax sp.]
MPKTPASAASAAGAANDPASARAACAALKGSLAESAAGLKLVGATVDSATFVQSGSAAACTLTGSATLAEADAAPIRFQVSVPSDWNRHAIQLVDGVEAAHPLVDPQAAVAAGYMSYGLAGGGNAANNGERLAVTVDARVVAAQKKLYEVAQELMARRFGRLSDRVYLVSGAGDTTALELVKRNPYDYRGLLLDATGPVGSATTRKLDEPTPAETATPTVSFDAKSAATALASFIGVGGKLLVLAPASFPSTLRGFGLPEPTLPVPSGIAGEAPDTAVLMAYRDLFERAGERYLQASVKLYPMPPGEPRAAEKEKVDWLQVLIDFAENAKTPPALAELPTRR